MCTIGAITTAGLRGVRRNLLVKNCDAWRDAVIRHRLVLNGQKFLNFSIEPQGGVNAGMNEFGLCVAISYSDYRSRSSPGEKRTESVAPHVSLVQEPRTLMNELVLAQCRSVTEALDLMIPFIAVHPDMMGGNHLLLDRDGAIVMVEHCEGKSAVLSYGERGYVARANNSESLIREHQAKMAFVRDSLDRQTELDVFLGEQRGSLSSGDVPSVVASIKAKMGSHPDEGKDVVGSLCVHGLIGPGYRSTAAGPHAEDPLWTVSSMLFDLELGEMQYSVGNPCVAQWRTLSL